MTPDQLTLDTDWLKAQRAEQQGDLRTALGHYRILVQRFPANSKAFFALARIATQVGEYPESRIQMEAGLRLAPKEVAAWAQLGFVCVRLGDLGAAEKALANAIRLDPKSAPLHINYANVQKQLGKPDLARRELETALKLSPRNVLALYNFGNLWRDVPDFDKAADCYRRALAIEPQHVDSLYNLGCLLRDRDEVEQAQAMFEAAVRINPKRFDAWHNLANAKRAQGDWKGARAGYQAALAGGEWALPRYALGTLDLLEKNWSQGWLGYEARWEANKIPRLQSQLVRWQGEDVGPESRLLVYTEQGYGDIIQFARFFPLLAQRFAHVGVHCPSLLARLFQQNFIGGITVFDALQDKHAASYTHYVHIMSLGNVLQVDESLLNAIAAPYLRASAPCRFPQDGSVFKIGFTWMGNPVQIDNAHRSIPLAALASLFDAEGTKWYSLQKGAGAALAPWSELVSDESDVWQDFADSANFIAGLDLVITVCTAQAHLAGALGKPVWLLSRFDADWRWQLNRQDSPWYPATRIFRQSRRGDWRDVIERIGDALKARNVTFES